MDCVFQTSAAVATLAQSASAIAAHPGAVPAQRVVHPQYAAAIAPAADLEVLMMVGAGSVALMLLCRLYQREVPWFGVATVVFGLIASVYGFLSGAWPLGIALAAYSIGRFHTWLTSRRRVLHRAEPVRHRVMIQPWEESRMTRMFGPM